MSGNLNLKNTLQECFNFDTIVPSIYFPCLLENLSNNIHKAFTSDYFINKCTLLPIYVPFLSVDRRNLIVNDMKYEKGKRIYSLLGIQAGHILEINSLKYCPICAQEDYIKYKETYFRRLHQCDGVRVCSKHECFLKKYNPNDASRLEYISLDYKDVDFKAEYENDDILRKWYIEISKSYEFLLSNDLFQFNNNKIHEMYIHHLDSHGYLTPSKRVKQIELAEQFTEYYGEKMLNSLNCYVTKNESNWLRKITLKPKSIIHPLRHILFIIFLCGSLERFFHNKIYYHPFGEGPYPCLNVASGHYLKDVISDCIITRDYKTGQPVGTFVCNYCGFVYSRKGPDLKPEDRFRIGRIKKFGHIWEQKLLELVDEGKYNLKSLSEKMNCDPKTIVKYAKNLSVADRINTKMKIRESSVVNKKENNFNYKDELLNFIRLNPQLSRTEVRNLMKKQYTWLYRHEREWLMKNLPHHIAKSKIEYKPNRVNWNERDVQIYNTIRTDYETLMNSGKLVRITKSLLGKRTGYRSLLDKHIEKLPMTSQLLKQICESIEDFQKRRIKIVAEQLYKNNGSFKRWELVRAAGISKIYESKLVDFIDCIVKKYEDKQDV